MFRNLPLDGPEMQSPVAGVTSSVARCFPLHRCHQSLLNCHKLNPLSKYFTEKPDSAVWQRVYLSLLYQLYCAAAADKYLISPSSAPRERAVQYRVISIRLGVDRISDGLWVRSGPFLKSNNDTRRRQRRRRLGIVAGN